LVAAPRSRRSARAAAAPCSRWSSCPLYVPVLIFGVSGVEGAVMGLGGRAQLLILGAMLLAALALAPFASAAALRLALE